MLEHVSLEEIEAIFESMPVEVSFIDVNEKVRYFNKGMNRIFPRHASVIGKDVRNCHPEKSLDKVLTIINDFKTGKRNKAEFWIDLKGMKVHIRYFPVKDKNGKYLGTLEVSQDIAPIQAIQGEKRLLD